MTDLVDHYSKSCCNRYKENSSDLVILEVGEHYMGSLHDFFKNAIHDVIEMARS